MKESRIMAESTGERCRVDRGSRGRGEQDLCLIIDTVIGGSQRLPNAADTRVK
jgi:hypothetical protein